MQPILINWSLAKCSCPSWSANTDESALRIALASLDGCNSLLHWWLGFWTIWVVVGVALELVFVVWEYVDELHDFRRGFVHPPDKPSRLLFALGFFATGLVALGVGGELYAESKIATLETCIRKGNDSLFLLLSKEVDDAKRIASENEKKAQQLGKDAESERLARVKIEAAVAWRSLSDKDKRDIGTAVSGFKDTAGASVWFNASSAEAEIFADDIADALHSGQIILQPPAGLVEMRGSGKFGDPIVRATTGVSVASSADEVADKFASILIAELNHRGFDAVKDPKHGEDKKLKVPAIWVNVEPRPRGPQGEYKLQAEREAKAKNASKSTH